MMTRKMLLMVLALIGITMSVSAVTLPEMVLIDQAGNPDDIAPKYGYVKTPAGGVAYDYYMSKYEITVDQFASYLNEAAGIGDPKGLYTSDMYYSMSGPQQIQKSGDSYIVNAGWGNRPAAYISYVAAARYCNYLTSGDTEVGVYTFRDSVMGPIVNESVKTGSEPAYWIPTHDELYKAHFYNADTGQYEMFATGSSVVPTNVPDGTGNNANFGGGVATYRLTEVGAYGENSWGLSDTGGNVQEWTEEWNWGSWISQPDGSSKHFYGPFYHGGSYYSGSPAFMQDDFWTGYHPTDQGDYTVWENHGWFDNGMRIASNVPEPATMSLLALTGFAMIRRKRN